MSDTITINTAAFAKLSTPNGKPVAFIVRQVGDGPVAQYHLTRNGSIHIYRDSHPEPGSMVDRAMQTARIHAEATGSVGGNCIEENSHEDFSVAASWVREGSPADLPVVVEQA